LAEAEPAREPLDERRADIEVSSDDVTTFFLETKSFYFVSSRGMQYFDKS